MSYNGFKIRVQESDPNTNGVFDTSDNPFTIQPPKITLIYPVGGEIFTAGRNLNIVWRGAGVINNIDIVLEGGGSFGSVNMVIANNIPAAPSGIDYLPSYDGQFNWTISTSGIGDIRPYYFITVREHNPDCLGLCIYSKNSNPFWIQPRIPFL